MNAGLGVRVSVDEIGAVADDRDVAVALGAGGRCVSAAGSVAMGDSSVGIRPTDVHPTNTRGMILTAQLKDFPITRVTRVRSLHIDRS